MANKSGGTIPPPAQIADANQAVAILSTMHYWRATKQNSSAQGVRHLVDITHAGKRVSASRKSFVDAAIAALAKLRWSDDKPKLKLIGATDAE